MEPTAKTRKRDALGKLRDIAFELDVPHDRRKADFSAAAFEALHVEVLQQSSTPEQRRGAAEAMALFRGLAEQDVQLPQVPALPKPAPPPPPMRQPYVPMPPLPALPGHAAQPELAPEESEEQDGPIEGGFRLRSSSCLFTWNSKAFADVPQQVVWQSFWVFLRSLRFVCAWTATLELSLKSKHHGRLHLHAFLEFFKAPDWTTLDLVKFQGVCPNAAPTKARGDNQRQVKDEGHFYAWAWKVGTVFVETSGYLPWTDYKVMGGWIDGLWSAHKLEHKTYLAYAAQIRVGVVNRMKQVEAVQERERREYLRTCRGKVALQLAALRSETKPDIKALLALWQKQYAETLERFKFLVIQGASQTGKSTLARTLGGPGGTPFGQTVQSAVSPDLKAYDPNFHSYLVFDNVNSMPFVMDHRAMSQAKNDIHTLGESRTGMYSYEVRLYQVPIVFTVDLSADWDTADEWIKENCVDIFLEGPSWVEA